MQIENIETSGLGAWQVNATRHRTVNSLGDCEIVSDVIRLSVMPRMSVATPARNQGKPLPSIVGGRAGPVI